MNLLHEVIINSETMQEELALKIFNRLIETKLSVYQFNFVEFEVSFIVNKLPNIDDLLEEYCVADDEITVRTFHSWKEYAEATYEEVTKTPINYEKFSF